MPRTRGTVRIQGHDYSESGEYCVTMCTFQMRCLFGEIKNGQIRLNPFGQVVEEEWLKTSCLRSDVKLDEFVIMPNHVHGIVKFRDFQAEQKLACDPFKRTAVRPYAEHVSSPLRCPPGSLGSIVKGFKSACQRRINLLGQTPEKPVWQRNYHEHIIRDDQDLDDVLEYIQANPLRWKQEHPRAWH